MTVSPPGAPMPPSAPPRPEAIPIEERAPEEVSLMTGETAAGAIETVRIVPRGSPVSNFAFDVTPARLVTGLITERGICPASEAGLTGLFPGEEDERAA